MSPVFIKGVKEYLPEATITFDKFHILKVINGAVDQVRREEVSSQPILRKTRYVFLKNQNNLTINKKETLEELQLSKLNLKSIRALHIRENFQEIYKAPSEEEFKILMKKWYFWAAHSRLAPIIKAAKAKARGFKTFRNFRIVVFLLTGDLNFKVLNPNVSIK